MTIQEHRAHYARFVTPAIKSAVLRVIGRERILASTDPHLNDIPLQRWDSMAGYRAFPAPQGNWRPPQMFFHAVREVTGERRPVLSLSTCVCILKEAARHIQEEGR